MATDKKKKEVKVRDLKPSKDAKGGAGSRSETSRGMGGHGGSREQGMRGGQANTTRGGAL